MRVLPHLTVATVVEHNGRFLMVEERPNGSTKTVFNQPAGHVEINESITDAALRETLEETGWDVELTGVLGIYRYVAPSNGVTYQRVCFSARPLQHHPERELDDGIIQAHWLCVEELRSMDNLRSVLVLQSVDDFLQGERYPLSLIRN